jgi:hypothetical protein
VIHTGRYVDILSAIGIAGGGAATAESGGGNVPTDWEYSLITWSITSAFILLDVTRDSNSAIIRASIQWPDETLGDLVTTQASTYPGCVDAYTITYLGVDSYLITQPAVTRDSNGAILTQPPITIQKGV